MNPSWGDFPLARQQDMRDVLEPDPEGDEVFDRLQRCKKSGQLARHRIDDLIEERRDERMIRPREVWDE